MMTIANITFDVHLESFMSLAKTFPDGEYLSLSKREQKEYFLYSNRNISMRFFLHCGDIPEYRKIREVMDAMRDAGCTGRSE